VSDSKRKRVHDLTSMEYYSKILKFFISYHVSKYSCIIYTWKCHKETFCVTILNKQKMSFFFFYKIGEQEDGTGSAWEVDTSGREDGGKGCRRMNMVQILCTHVCKWKNDTLIKLFQEWGRDKGEWWLL
jgi:hypothetical protein